MVSPGLQDVSYMYVVIMTLGNRIVSPLEPTNHDVTIVAVGGRESAETLLESRGYTERR